MKTCALVLACLAPAAAFSPQNTGRRDFLASAVGGIVTATTVAAPSAQAVVKGSAPQGTALGKIDKKSPVGKEIESWNSLIYNFKNNRLDGGLDAKTLKEPSISFTEFGEKLKNGEVTFVEFLAPNGDVAYATVKKSKNAKGKGSTERLRIGQGYPTTSKNSWSSPDYVIRAVSNFGVPYAFTVPALSKYKKTAPAAATTKKGKK